MSIVDIKEYEYAGDIFFEITHPPELQYTYRIRPAKSFGMPFVNNIINYPSLITPILGVNKYN